MKTAAPDQVIADRYRLLSRISSGGMGAVYRARDSVLGRVVALKILPANLASDVAFVARFRGEAQAAARLNHPNVVQVYDWGRWESTYFMVMEFVRGQNLREILSSQLEVAHAVEIARQMLEGLHAAHTHSLVHRDVKPENVMVDVSGLVKVTDFGIARFAGAPATGSVFGTLGYVAPERLEGEPGDHCSDIYSVGCVLYEMLAGVPPFEGEGTQLIRQHLEGRVPPPSAARPEARVLDEIVARATEPTPEDRYPTAGDMKADLEAVADTLTGGGPLSELTSEVTSEVSEASLETMAVPASSGRRWWPVILVPILAVLAVLGFIWRPMRVPDVVGMPEAQAVRELQAAGLEVIVERQFSEQPSGVVIEEQPGAGAWTVSGRTVVLMVSRGPPLTDLGLLVGLTLEQATDAVEGAGLQVGEITRAHDQAPPGVVIAQDPQPGRVRSGDPVNLVVSEGPEMVTVPEVVGKTYDEAAGVLAERGLEPRKEEVFDDAPEGQVLGQNPEAGERVEKGSTVLLRVSKGPEPFEMPDVSGKSCSEARDQLASLGLEVVVRSRSGGCGANEVLDQDPLPGATVRKGDEATLFVS